MNQNFPLSSGQVFPTYKELYRTVIGENPPKSGKKNIDAAKRNLARYVEWQSAYLLNPSITSKRAVIVTKVYDSPLPVKRDTGRRGVYIDDLRALIIRQKSFDGKWTELENCIGLFKRYLFEKKKRMTSTEWDDFSRHINDRPWDYKLFKMSQTKKPVGSVVYSFVLSYQMKACISRALDSLQQEGILEWKEFYVILPDILELRSDFGERIAAKQELQARGTVQRKRMRKVAQQENCVLDADLLGSLLIGTRKWDALCDYEEYKQEFGGVASHEKFRAVRASPRQVRAVENFQRFILQVSYSEYIGSSTLVSEDQLPEKWQLYGNPQLHKIYSENEKMYKENFFGKTVFWKELEFRIIDSAKAQKYNSCEDSIDISDRLTCRFLRYMDAQMQKCKIIRPQATDNNDFGIGISHTKYCLLSETVSACALHEDLMQLYNAENNNP